MLIDIPAINKQLLWVDAPGIKACGGVELTNGVVSMCAPIFNKFFMGCTYKKVFITCCRKKWKAKVACTWYE